MKVVLLFRAKSAKQAWILQVCPDRVILLAGSSKQAETTMHELIAPPEEPTGVQSEKAAVAALPSNVAGVKILAASAADPYILLHLSNGSAALLQGSLESGAFLKELADDSWTRCLSCTKGTATAWLCNC